MDWLPGLPPTTLASELSVGSGETVGPLGFAPWQVMWTLGVVIFFILKGVLLAVRPAASRWAAANFLVATPTLEPEAYARPGGERLPSPFWWRGIVGLVAAGGTFLLVVPLLRPWSEWAAGLLAMCAICGALHFGVFVFIVAMQRRLGFDVQPIMDRPWASTSLAEFWGRRWNRAFRDVATRLLARPLLRKRWSPLLVSGLVFLASGVVHDVVMSAPAGGWGRPTAYFLLQFAGLALQRTPLARRWRLDRGLRGWIVTAVVLLAPVPLLFHRPYCVDIMLPFYDWLCGLAGYAGPGDLSRLVFAGGWMQWSVLVASALVPVSLDWKQTLEPLPSIVRQLFWTYGGYLVGAIVFLGAASVLWADEVASGSGLGRGVAVLTALFWGVRLLLGWFVFDAQPFLDRTWKQLGYELLNVNFALLTTLYTAAAIA